MKMYTFHSRCRPKIRRSRHVYVSICTYKKRKIKHVCIMRNLFLFGVQSVTSSVFKSVIPFWSGEFLPIAFVQFPRQRHFFWCILPSTKSWFECTSSFSGHEHLNIKTKKIKRVIFKQLFSSKNNLFVIMQDETRVWQCTYVEKLYIIILKKKKTINKIIY